MKRGNLAILFVCVMLVIMAVPMNASTDTNATVEKEEVLIQPRFTNISVFYNDFYITDQGKAVLTSYIDARNVDECKINMYLQRYQNGSWITVKSWSVTESGTFCGIGKTWYVISGFQYRMTTYGYVYSNGVLLESTNQTSQLIIY